VPTPADARHREQQRHVGEEVLVLVRVDEGLDEHHARMEQVREDAVVDDGAVRERRGGAADHEGRPGDVHREQHEEIGRERRVVGRVRVSAPQEAGRVEDEPERHPEQRQPAHRPHHPGGGGERVGVHGGILGPAGARGQAPGRGPA
jgi:hypothetical protein